jgi:hypothetical protein
VVVVRYQDDISLGLQYQTNADHVLGSLREWVAKFGLELQLDNRHGIEFDWFAEKTGDVGEKVTEPDFVNEHPRIASALASSTGIMPFLTLALPLHIRDKNRMSLTSSSSESLGVLHEWYLHRDQSHNLRALHAGGDQCPVA